MVHFECAVGLPSARVCGLWRDARVAPPLLFALAPPAPRCQVRCVCGETFTLTLPYLRGRGRARTGDTRRDGLGKVRSLRGIKVPSPSPKQAEWDPSGQPRDLGSRCPHPSSPSSAMQSVQVQRNGRDVHPQLPRHATPSTQRSRLGRAPSRSCVCCTAAAEAAGWPSDGKRDRDLSRSLIAQEGGEIRYPTGTALRRLSPRSRDLRSTARRPSSSIPSAQTPPSTGPSSTVGGTRRRRGSGVSSGVTSTRTAKKADAA